MKRFIIISFIFANYISFGQSETAFFNAFKIADTQALDSYLTDNIDFCIFENQEILTKKAALVKLKNFLSGYKITAIEVIHKGTSKDRTSQYKVAKVSTTKDTFRVFVYVTGEFKASSVKEIRIDKF